MFENFSYWSEFAIASGHDQLARQINAFGFDVGGTYRFPWLPLSPSITLGYALGSGGSATGDRTNKEFRQTGLQSNEQKFAGLSEFKYYGEVLDPELSNLKIFTAGIGFRPFRDTSVDLVYHIYRLHAFSEDLRNSGLTAQLNQDATRTSYDVGREVDLIIGFRNVFGIQRLGIDVRAGLFFPGTAFVNDLGGDNFTRADLGSSVIVKFWW
jgi:alginate production protein